MKSIFILETFAVIEKHKRVTSGPYYLRLDHQCRLAQIFRHRNEILFSPNTTQCKSYMLRPCTTMTALNKKPQKTIFINHYYLKIKVLFKEYSIHIYTKI